MRIKQSTLVHLTWMCFFGSLLRLLELIVVNGWKLELSQSLSSGCSNITEIVYIRDFATRARAIELLNCVGCDNFLYKS